MTKLLLTGISGFLGWNLCQVISEKWELHGTYHNHPLEHEQLKSASPLDITDRQQVRELIRDLQPDAVIHAAGLTNLNECQKNPRLSEEINVWGTSQVARLCMEQGIRMIFTSTDQVFEGRKGNYRESDSPAPLNRYGEHKFWAEQLVKGIHPKATICRMPLMFGDPGPQASNFFTDFLETMQRGDPISLFTDEYRTPLEGRVAAKGLLNMLEKNIPGVVHLGGPERVSRYDFGKIMQEVFDLPDDVIQAGKQSEVSMAAPRPHDISMDSSKAKRFGYAPAPLKSQLESLTSILK